MKISDFSEILGYLPKFLICRYLLQVRLGQTFRVVDVRLVRPKEKDFAVSFDTLFLDNWPVLPLPLALYREGVSPPIIPFCEFEIQNQASFAIVPSEQASNFAEPTTSVKRSG